MKNIILLFLFLIPAFLFAQYPATGNKSRLGYQTTGDGLIWRGVAADTVTKPRTTANAYFQLDTVNGVLRRYIATLGKWQTVGGGGASIDSLIYSTIKGLNDSIQAEKQTLFFDSGTGDLSISDGNNVSLLGILNGYTSGTGTANRVPVWNTSTSFTNSNIQDNGTAVSILSSKPFLLGQWTTAGRPSGVNGYMGYNTTNNTPEFYSSSRWVAPAQADNADGKFLFGSIPYADANGRLKYGSYAEIYMSAVDFVVYRAGFFSSNQAGVTGALKVSNTNTSSLGYASVILYPSSGGHFGQFFQTNLTYPGYGAISADCFGHYTTGAGGMGIQLDDPAASVRFGIGTTGTIEKMRLNAIGLGIGRTAINSKLEVQGAGEFHGATGVTYIGAYGGSFPDPSAYNTGYIYNTNTRFGIFSGPGFSVQDDILLHATATKKVSIRAINDTIPGIGISLSKATFIRHRLIIAPDSTFKFDPTTDVLQLSQYGAGTKEATDLSKTESIYNAIYAMDGTVIEKRANTEQYNAITSTTSPVTLSSTIADNLINQGGTQATFTFRLPASPIDGQISKATFANAVTVLTIDGNGTTVTGTLPTAAAVGQQIIFKNYTGLGWVRQL